MIATALLIASSSTFDPPRTTGTCKWVRGRFDVWNGSSLRRIWVIGTHRVVALYDEDEHVPDVVKSYIRAGPYPEKARGLLGEFRICPLEQSRRRHLQHVRLTAARHLSFVGQHFPPRR